MKFDIAAKLVSPSQRAWVVHAGKAQFNYKAFVENNLVFLEAPYIQLTEKILSTREGIRQALRRSVDWRKYAETTGSHQPSEKLQDYDGGTFEDSELTALSGSISRLYGQAKPGDLVIVPGTDIFNEMLRPVVRIGEIISNFDPEDIYTGGRASSVKVPVRRVRWLRVVPRKEISLYLDKKVGKPPAVREIKIERDTEELLKHAYDSYIFEGNSSGLITADKYDGSDFVLLNRSSELIAFLVAAHAAFQQQNPPNSIENIQEFTEKYFKDASVENIEVDFASPGYWRILGASVSLAAFVGLGITALSSDLTADVLANGIEVTNSIAPDDPTAKQLEDSMNMALKSMDKMALKKAIETAKTARNVIGLQSPTKTAE